MEIGKSIWQKIFYSTFVKIFIGISVCVAVLAISHLGLISLFKGSSLSTENKNLLITIVSASLVLIAYTTLYKYYEKRKITELSANHLAQSLGIGILTGGLLQALTIYVIFLAGGFAVISVNSFIYILGPLALSFGSAITEEIIFRGILFRILEQRLGSYYALGISALFFGLAHFANPNSSLVSSLGIAVEAGLLLGVAYMYSKNLWLPIAIHFAWNFTQAGIFGATTSGNQISKSLLTTKITGPAYISGGAFGPEGSLQAMLFSLTAVIILIPIIQRQGKIVKPYWVIKKQSAATSNINTAG